jgi:hypothetical protein
LHPAACLIGRLAGAAAEAYLQGLAESGNFPNLAAFGAAGLLDNEYDQLAFDTGLNWLLTGIAADCAHAGSPESIAVTGK